MESKAMKREYMKPTIQVVHLQHQHQLLAGSLTSTSTNLDKEDDFEIEDTPAGGGFWGR